MLTIVETCGIVMAGILLLRLSGRKSVAQMTIGTTVVVLMLGTLLASPIEHRRFSTTMIVMATAIGFLVLLEYLQLKFRPLSTFITGKPITVVQNGQVCTSALKKTRIPLQQLEMRLRVAGINHIEDVQSATIEVNGDLGYELKAHAKPMTTEQFEAIMKPYMEKFNEMFASQAGSFTMPQVHVLNHGQITPPEKDERLH